ncbi:MAG TPA: NADH-quinone oxidoreductase subunit C [Balneolales bacterium]|nr:NADH-quinone oxidoreductase subunit C [Balneolales bacterium]
MTGAEVKQNIESKWSGKISEIGLKSEKRLFVTISPESLPEVAQYLFDDLKCRFITASALQSKRGFEIYYHFSVDVIGLIINVHVVLPESKPEVESLANISVATNWIEREMHELFGIIFLNHPNMEKLISEGNWEEGEYPLRKN